MDLQTLIRNIPDFPKPGVQFKDITPLLENAQALQQAIRDLAAPFVGAGITKVAATESRGFLFGPAIAMELQCGFVPIRKKGKLPSEVYQATYELEYGQDVLEMHKDAIHAQDSVLVVDDVLATGGTLNACLELIQRAEGHIAGFAVLVELDFLAGRSRLPGQNIHSLIHY
jgi:adenine phosphoribosyltransferase